MEGVSAVYTADNGAGAAITASAKGYGGDVGIMVGINADEIEIIMEERGR